MFELIYRSLAKGGINTTDITGILNKSRNFNSQNDITGCLLFYNNEFIQILEGDKKKVTELYATIKKDRRHTDVMLLDENEKEERIFTNWSMAYFDLNGADVKEADKLLFIENFIITANITEKPTHAVKLFWHIAKQMLEE